jgi:hypothetical protein
VVGKRVGYGREPMPPHSLVLTMVGASMLWVGWFGFNAGSNLEANGVAGLVNGVATTVGSPGAITTAGGVFSGVGVWNAATGGAWGTGASGNWTSAEGVAELRRLGLRPILLTGDNRATADAVARQVGIDPADVRADVLPADKLAVVRDLQPALHACDGGGRALRRLPCRSAAPPRGAGGGRLWPDRAATGAAVEIWRADGDRDDDGAADRTAGARGRRSAGAGAAASLAAVVARV